VLVALVGLAFVVGLQSSAHATTPITVTFGYNGTNGTDGSAQTWTVPANVYAVTLDVAGAQGSTDPVTAPGGKGGEAIATVGVVPGEELQINVGGSPTSAPSGGFNGGGAGGVNSCHCGGGAGGGGGASDVRTGAFGLSDRVIVGGGGGGGAGDGGVAVGPGGAGGGSTGSAGANGGVTGGGGGTQSAGGAGGVASLSELDGSPGELGVGGAGGGESGGSGGGGGGGYFGGGGGADANGDPAGGGSGGGGSGVGPSGVVFHPGMQLGNGKVTITYTPSGSDLAISVGASPAPVAFGGQLTYTVTAQNAGPDPAQQVSLQDVLPSESGFVSETSGAASCIAPAAGATGTLTCTIASIAAGTQDTITVVVHIDAAPGSSVSDTVSASTGSTDQNPANNTATVTTGVVQAATSLVAAPATRTGSAYTSVTMSARLTSTATGAGIGSQNVTFLVGKKSTCSAQTNSSGVAGCTVKLAFGQHVPSAYSVSFAGSADYLPSSATGKA
jgi:uncharacterized repeat protein (TIGR01451 family)